jgi:hypothetical protein
MPKKIANSEIILIKKCELLLKHLNRYKDDSELLVNNSPYDFFKVINEGFDISYQNCPIK